MWDTFGTKSVTGTLRKKWNEAGGTKHVSSCLVSPGHRFIIKHLLCTVSMTFESSVGYHFISFISQADNGKLESLHLVEFKEACELINDYPIDVKV